MKVPGHLGWRYVDNLRIEQKDSKSIVIYRFSRQSWDPPVHNWCHFVLFEVSKHRMGHQLVTRGSWLGVVLLGIKMKNIRRSNASIHKTTVAARSHIASTTWLLCGNIPNHEITKSALHARTRNGQWSWLAVQTAKIPNELLHTAEFWHRCQILSNQS